jgi:hypothetical protein
MRYRWTAKQLTLACLMGLSSRECIAPHGQYTQACIDGKMKKILRHYETHFNECNDIQAEKLFGRGVKA